LVLAAGSGRRFGQPKALVDTGSGPWILRTLEVLAGCDDIIVVTGAQADAVATLLPDGVQAVRNPAHTTGLGSSVRVGLAAAGRLDAAAALVMLVDLPDVTRATADRLASRFRSSAAPASLLARATYRGEPGHPVLIGRNHFAAISGGAIGDTGARRYLCTHDVDLVECGDIGGGRDVDTANQVRWPGANTSEICRRPGYAQTPME